MPESGPPGADPGRGASLRGEVVYLYAFDVANEIRLDRAAELLSARPVPFAARPERASRESLPAARPLEVEPAPPAAGLRGRQVRPLVHVYDVGVVCGVLRVPIEVDALPELAPFQSPSLDDGRPLAFAEVMRSAAALNGSYYNAQRMVTQYLCNAYRGCAAGAAEANPAALIPAVPAGA